MPNLIALHILRCETVFIEKSSLKLESWQIYFNHVTSERERIYTTLLSHLWLVIMAYVNHIDMINLRHLIELRISHISQSY